MTQSILRHIRASLPLLTALGVWEIASRLLADKAPLCPPPSRCLIALGRWARDDHMLRDLAASYGRFLAGLIIGGGSGIIIGLITGRVRAVSAALSPLLNALRALPPISLLPLVLVWVGASDGARIGVVSFGVFLVVWLNTHTGASQIPEKLIWAASTLTKSRRQLFFGVVLPCSAGYSLAGLRQAIGIGFTLVFVSELLGATAGIGYRINIWSLAYRADSMIAGLVVLGISAAVADWGLRLLSDFFLPWLALEDSSRRREES
jgi:ABC-type nitrate/sulfonate/bicarbonate transport system permease component